MALVVLSDATHRRHGPLASHVVLPCKLSQIVVLGEDLANGLDVRTIIVTAFQSIR